MYLPRNSIVVVIKCNDPLVSEIYYILLCNGVSSQYHICSFPCKSLLRTTSIDHAVCLKKNTKEKIGTRIIAAHNYVKFHVLDNIFLISDFQVQACDIFSTTDYIIVAKHEKRA